MRTSNIRINIKKGEKVPFQETYFVEFNSKSTINIVQKFIDQSKNQKISVDFRGCKKLYAILAEYISRKERNSLRSAKLI